MDNSNAGQRTLGARQTTQGQKDALENIASHGLHNGASCYVIEQQANYRYVQGSKLAADGVFVVKPVGDKGRFVREGGLTGFALLDEGALKGSTFGGWLSSHLVQFELAEDGGALYTGAVPRVAIVSATAQLLFERGGAELFLAIANQRLLFSSVSLPAHGFASLSALYRLMPGDRVSLGAALEGGGEGKGSLRILLT